MTKQVRNKGFILGRVCARANMLPNAFQQNALPRSCTDVMAERRVGLFVFRCAAENDAARNDLAFSRHERSQQKRRKLRRIQKGRGREKA